MQPSTLMSRFFAHTPAPKRYLARSIFGWFMRRTFENPGFSVANIANHGTTRRQSFG